MSSSLRVACLLTLLVGVAPPSAALAGAKRKVPQQYPTIQAAVNACSSGDTIVVSSGTYAESVLLAGKQGVTLRTKGKVVVKSPAFDAITLDACHAAKVRGFRVEDGDVRVIGSNGVQVTKCRISNGGYGIRVEGSTGVRIEKNRISNTASAPISVSGTGCIIENNRSKNVPQGSGWNLSGDGHTVIGNRIEGCLWGMNVGGSAHLIADNRLQDQGESGLDLGTSDSSILDNVIGRTRDGLTSTQSYGAVIAGNVLVKLEQYGIDLVASYDLDVRDNKVRKAQSAGIHTGADDSVFRRNDVAKCGSFGIYVLGDDGIFVENRAKAQAGGVDIYDAVGATGNVYVDNTGVLVLN